MYLLQRHNRFGVLRLDAALELGVARRTNMEGAFEIESCVEPQHSKARQ